MKIKYLFLLISLLSQILIYSQAPNLLWINQSNSTDEVGSVSVSESKNDHLGNFVIAGSYYKNVNFGNSSFYANDRNSFVTKLNSSGSFIWTKSINSTGKIFSYSLDIDSQNNIYLIGNFNGVATFGDITLVSDEAAGSGSTPTSFITKINSDGEFIWAKKIEKLGSMRVNINADDDLLLFSIFSGELIVDGVVAFGNDDYLIMKIDSEDGKAIFGKKITNVGESDFLRPSINSDSSNNIYFATSFTTAAIIDDNVINGSSTVNILIGKLDSSGNFVWAKRAGGNANDYGQEIMLDGENNIYLAGNFNSDTITFDDYNIVNSGDLDVYLTKLNNSGDFLWAKSYGTANADIFYHSVVDSTGNVVLTYGKLDTSFYSKIINIDKNGNQIWNKEITGAGVKTLSLDDEGNLYSAGIFKDAVNLDGFELQADNSAIKAWFGKLGSTLSTNESEKSEILIGPVPVKDFLSIVDYNNQVYLIKIFDASGKIVFEKNDLNKIHQINLSQLQKGNYFVSISTKEGKTIYKTFIKK